MTGAENPGVTHGDTPTPAQLREALAHAEATLTHASMRLGRLRSRNRGAPLSRDLTAVAFDIQAARDVVVAVLDALATADDTMPD